MNKKIIAGMIAATLLFVCVFAACNKDEDEVADKVYIGADEYPFFTDENGNRVLDENGEYIVYQTDEDGRYRKDEYGDRLTTNRYFEAYSEGNLIEDYGYKMIFPDGWISTDKAGSFTNEQTGDVFSVDPIGSTTYKENYDVAKQLCELATEKENYTATLEENITKFGEEFENMFCLSVSDGESVYIVYTFKNNGNLYCVSYQSTNPDTSIEALDELMKCITFKPYQYYVSTTSFEVTTTNPVTTAE